MITFPLTEFRGGNLEGWRHVHMQKTAQAESTIPIPSAQISVLLLQLPLQSAVAYSIRGIGGLRSARLGELRASFAPFTTYVRYACTQCLNLHFPRARQGGIRIRIRNTSATRVNASRHCRLTGVI